MYNFNRSEEKKQNVTSIRFSLFRHDRIKGGAQQRKKFGRLIGSGLI